MSRSRPECGRYGGAERLRRQGPRDLSHAIGSLRRRVAPRTLLAAVQERWEAAVGLSVSQEAQPVSEQDGVVMVLCRSAVWASELVLLSETLREQLNASLENDRQIRCLKFMTRPL